MTIRFKFDPSKAIQAIHFLAVNNPGITQYYVGKVLFFADREHLLDWGRPISGDRYVAMNHGPVPSFTYDLLKAGSGEPDDLTDELCERVAIAAEGNKLHVFPKKGDGFDLLSETDREYLLSSLKTYGTMSFGRLRDLSHEDAAYCDAWAKDGLNNEMDVQFWLGELEDADAAASELIERSSVDRARSRHKAA